MHNNSAYCILLPCRCVFEVNITLPKADNKFVNHLFVVALCLSSPESSTTDLRATGAKRHQPDLPQ
jgi:hypothetical protein